MKKCFFTLVAAQEIFCTANFADLGFDSVALVELAIALEKRVGVRVTPDVFFGHPTISRLAPRLIEMGAAFNGTAMSESESLNSASDDAEPVTHAPASPVGRRIFVRFSSSGMGRKIG